MVKAVENHMATPVEGLGFSGTTITENQMAKSMENKLLTCKSTAYNLTL